MTESQEHQDTTVDPIRPPRGERPDWLYRALALVGIVAGSLFIVATIFFSGYVLGKNSDGGSHHGPNRMLSTPFHKGVGPGGPMGPEGRMEPGGRMGPDARTDPDDGPRSARLTPPSVSSVQPRP